MADYICNICSRYVDTNPHKCGSTQRAQSNDDDDDFLIAAIIVSEAIDSGVFSNDSSDSDSSDSFDSGD